MTSNIGINDTLESLSDELREYSSHLLHSFDKVEKDIDIFSRRRNQILLERTRDVSKKMKVIDQESNLNTIS